MNTDQRNPGTDNAAARDRRGPTAGPMGIRQAFREIRRPQTSEQDVRSKMGIDTDTAIAAMNGDFDAARKVMGEAADIRAVAPVGINFGRKGR